MTDRAKEVPPDCEVCGDAYNMIWHENSQQWVCHSTHRLPEYLPKKMVEIQIENLITEVCEEFVDYLMDNECDFDPTKACVYGWYMLDNDEDSRKAISTRLLQRMEGDSK